MGSSIGYISNTGQTRLTGGSQPVPTGKAADGRTIYSDGSMGWTQWKPIQGPAAPAAPRPSAPTQSYGGGGGPSAPTPQPQQSYQAPNIQDSINMALNTFRQSNAPAISSLQSSIDPLKQRYNDILASIKQNQTVAENATTLTTNNELGQRGLLPQSTLAQQEVNKAVAPVSAQFSGLYANTGLQEQKDINDINNAIAQLQSGNPQAALTFAGQQQGYGLQAQQLAQQLAQNQIQNQQEAQRIGISGGNLALSQKQFDYNSNPIGYLQQQGVDPFKILGLTAGNVTGNTNNVGTGSKWL